MKDLENRTMTFDHRRFNENTGINLQRRHGKPKAINFEAYAAEGNHFVNEVAFRIGSDRNTAARITRAVLHAMRDRLPPVDAIQFAQGLPMALKGIYFDQYNVSITPVRIRSARKFLDFVYEKNLATAQHDFPDVESLIAGLQAVCAVLEKHMSYGQFEQIKRLMGEQIENLLSTENIY